MNYLHFIEPVNYRIKEYNNEYRMFANIFAGESIYPYFKNNETIFDILNNNIDIPVLSINGKNPFDYINNFGGDFKRMKNPHASFRYKFLSRSGNTLLTYPLTYEELSNLTIIYDNGDKIETNFAIYSDINLTESQFLKQNKFFIFNNNEGIKKQKFGFKNSFSFNKDVKNFIIKNENNIFKNKIKDEDIKINWDFEIFASIGCKADEEKKMNVYYVYDFNSYDTDEYIGLIKKCTELFDNNDYPIILISIFNQGGIISNSQFLLELLSPTTNINMYGAFRNNGIYKDTINIDYKLLLMFYDSEKCQELNFEKFENNTKIIDYGENVIDYLSGPIILNGKAHRKDVESMKKKLKNPRKPTDIIVYTDSFSFSAGAMLVKYLQLYGGAITSAYFPNPILKEFPLDGGSCASVLYQSDVVEYFEIEEYKNLQNKGYYLKVPGIQLFYKPNDLKHPLEYEIIPVDEKSYIYAMVDYSRDILFPEDYDKFINESYKIFEKYKTQCNPNNKKLVLVTNKCDGKFGNNYTHGGYKWGDNGFWIEECIPSYCDIGYIFDYDSNKCIIDVCSNEKKEPDTKPEPDPKPEPKPESNSDSKTKDYIIISLSIIVSILFILIILLLYFLFKEKKLRKKVGINSVEKMNMSLEENMINK